MKVRLDKTIQDYLGEFDLSDREIIVYITLLKIGPSTIMNLSRETGIKRSTTHNNVEELIKKGLVSQTNYGERRMVIAEDPEKLTFLLQQKKWNVDKLESRLPAIVDAIKDMVPEIEKNESMKAKYYNGKKDLEYLYDLTLAADQVYSFVNTDRYFELFPEKPGYIYKEALKENPKRNVWEIITPGESSKHLTTSDFDTYHAKLLKQDSDLIGFDLIVFDGRVLIVELDKKSPSAVLITSEIIARSVTAIHKTLWELL